MSHLNLVPKQILNVIVKSDLTRYDGVDPKTSYKMLPKVARIEICIWNLLEHDIEKYNVHKKEIDYYLNDEIRSEYENLVQNSQSSRYKHLIEYQLIITYHNSEKVK